MNLLQNSGPLYHLRYCTRGQLVKGSKPLAIDWTLRTQSNSLMNYVTKLATILNPALAMENAQHSDFMFEQMGLRIKELESQTTNAT